MARIEAYTYSDSAGFGSANQLVVDDGGGADTATTLQPYVFSEFLTAMAALLATATGKVWTVTYSTTTRRVTIHVDAPATATLVLPENLSTFLGFSSTSYVAAQDHTAELLPAGRMELIGVECEAPMPADDAEVVSARHGRHYVPIFGNHQLQRFTLAVLRSRIPATTAYLLSGRVRIFPSSSSSPYHPVTDLGGYVDGYVVSQPTYLEPDPDGDIVEFGLTLAVVR